MLKNRGVNIIEAEDLDGNEFYVLESWCSSYREEVWKTANEGKDLLGVLEKETYPKVGFVIIIRDSLSGIETTINSALEQEDIADNSSLDGEAPAEQEVEQENEPVVSQA